MIFFRLPHHCLADGFDITNYPSYGGLRKQITSFLINTTIPTRTHCCQTLGIYEGRSDDPMCPQQLWFRFFNAKSILQRAAISCATIAACPFLAAMKSGVDPSSSHARSNLQRATISCVATAAFPFWISFPQYSAASLHLRDVNLEISNRISMSRRVHAPFDPRSDAQSPTISMARGIWNCNLSPPKMPQGLILVILVIINH